MNISNVSTLNFSPKSQSTKAHQTLITKQSTPTRTNFNAFPSYYCSNIAFNGSKFGSIDFDFDFYKASNDVMNNHLDKMELTKDLSEEEQDDFRNKLFSSDKATLMHFMFDKKPAILLSNDMPYFENNDKYSFVRRELDIPLKDNKTYRAQNTFILNNELVKQTIDENKELYTKRMGLNDETPTDKIFEELTSDNSILKQQERFDDIIGITLGFSPINSILFQVEQDIPNKIELRKRPVIHAKALDKSFNSKTSPYKDFSEEFKSNVQSSIDFIKENHFRKPDLGAIGYAYIHIAPDETHKNQIIKNAEEILDLANDL